MHRFKREGRGLIWATEKEHYFGPYGLLASNGEWAVELQYEYAAGLGEGCAVVRKRVGGTVLTGTVLTGAVDRNGDLVIPLRPWALYGWRNGWSLVKESYQGGKEGLLDRDGALIGGRFFDKVEPWSEGDVSTVLMDGRWVGLHRGGRIVPHPRNGRVFVSCPSGVRVIEVDGRAQITDANLAADNALSVRMAAATAHLRPALLGPARRQVGIVGLDGRLLFDPPSLDSVYPVDAGYAVVKQGANWGIVDTTGRFVLAPSFDGLIQRRDGLFHVLAGGRKVWLTATGEERPEPPVRISPAPGILNCGHGLKLMERDGHWGMADAEGKEGDRSALPRAGVLHERHRLGPDRYPTPVVRAWAGRRATREAAMQAVPLSLHSIALLS